MAPLIPSIFCFAIFMTFHACDYRLTINGTPLNNNVTIIYRLEAETGMNEEYVKSSVALPCTMYLLGKIKTDGELKKFLFTYIAKMRENGCSDEQLAQDYETCLLLLPGNPEKKLSMENCYGQNLPVARLFERLSADRDASSFNCTQFYQYVQINSGNISMQDNMCLTCPFFKNNRLSHAETEKAVLSFGLQSDENFSYLLSALSGRPGFFSSSYDIGRHASAPVPCIVPLYQAVFEACRSAFSAHETILFDADGAAYEEMLSETCSIFSASSAHFKSYFIGEKLSILKKILRADIMEPLLNNGSSLKQEDINAFLSDRNSPKNLPSVSRISSRRPTRKAAWCKTPDTAGQMPLSFLNELVPSAPKESRHSSTNDSPGNNEPLPFCTEQKETAPGQISAFPKPVEEDASPGFPMPSRPVITFPFSLREQENELTAGSGLLCPIIGSEILFAFAKDVSCHNMDDYHQECREQKRCIVETAYIYDRKLYVFLFYSIKEKEYYFLPVIKDSMPRLCRHNLFSLFRRGSIAKIMYQPYLFCGICALLHIPVSNIHSIYMGDMLLNGQAAGSFRDILIRVPHTGDPSAYRKFPPQSGIPLTMRHMIDYSRIAAKQLLRLREKGISRAAYEKKQLLHFLLGCSFFPGIRVMADAPPLFDIRNGEFCFHECPDFKRTYENGSLLEFRISGEDIREKSLILKIILDYIACGLAGHVRRYEIQLLEVGGDHIKIFCLPKVRLKAYGLISYQILQETSRHGITHCTVDAQFTDVSPE